MEMGCYTGIFSDQENDILKTDSVSASLLIKKTSKPKFSQIPVPLP